MGCVLSSTPFDFIYLLLNLQRLQVIKLRFMGLEFGMKFVFAGFLLQIVSVIKGCSTAEANSNIAKAQLITHCLVSLEEHYTASFVASRQIITSMIKLDR